MKIISDGGEKLDAYEEGVGSFMKLHSNFVELGGVTSGFPHLRNAKGPKNRS
jgi:hypothetical protein